MPFTANKAFKQTPRLLVSAKDMHYQSADGRQILDGTAGLWCVNAGHCRPPIVEAIKQAASTMDFGPTFQLGHPLAFQLATELARLMPSGLDRIFFSNSGSESVDSALKIALAYHRANGEQGRTRLIGRERGYHGTGFGGISVGGLVNNRRAFGALLPGVDHISHTHDLSRNAFASGQPHFGVERAEDLERNVALHGAETIAAVIVEPIAGSTGVLIPPIGYLERLREICSNYGILLIFDEVITGFGRIGCATAAERFGVTPDMITLAKGLTNAAVPMGAIATSRLIHDTIVNATATGIELFHGYTYSGHPLAAAAGLATLELYRSEALFARSRDIEVYWGQAIQCLRNLPHVIDCRNFGLVGAVELQPRKDAPTARANELFHRCFDAGLLVRATGDTIALSPPLIIETDQIDQIFSILSEQIKNLD
ncbi:MAG: aspartate aminotransferase family protein [Sphingomonadaceae bacterium]